MTIDTTDNVTDIATVRSAPDARPLIDQAKAAKLRAIIQAKTHAEREVERLRTEVETLRTARVAARDPRARQIWIDAARAATDAGRCHEYDDLVERIGGFTRDELRDAGELDRAYRVRTHVTVEVNLTIDAFDEDDAISRVDALDLGDIRELLSGQISSLVHDLDLESWDAREAELDE
ncbi:MAG: hypothetical protein J0G30_00125 [Actinomycetales bacterium]|nr:hypothetical protein [Actinomycetales bacterium]